MVELSTNDYEEIFERLKILEEKMETKKTLRWAQRKIDEKESLDEEGKDLFNLITNNINDFLLPVRDGKKTSDYLDDKKINLIRENLYDFMCVRRKLKEVNEFEYKGD